MSENQSTERSFGCVGCLFKSGLGCFSFAAGAVLVIGALAPAMLGDYVREVWFEQGWSKEHEGSLEVDALDLAWTRPQHVTGARILDPDGVEVLSGSAVLPPIFAFFSEEEVKFTLDVDAEVVVDETGRSNLARAFERTGSSGGSEVDIGVGRRPVRVEVRLDTLKWRDLRQGESAPETRLERTNVSAALPAGGGAVIEGDGAFDSDAGGTVGFKLEFPDPQWWEATSGAFVGEVQVTRAPSALLDSLFDGGGVFEELFGSHADVRVQAQQSEGVGTLDLLEIDSERLSLDCDGEFRAPRLFDPVAWERGSAVSSASASATLRGLPWDFVQERLPLDFELALEDAEDDELHARVENFTGQEEWALTLGFPRLRLEDAHLLTDATLALSRRAGTGLDFDFHAAHDHAGGGTLHVALDHQGSEAGALTVEARRAPTAWLERASGREGWMPFALGDHIDRLTLFVSDFESGLGRVAGELEAPATRVRLSSDWLPGLLRAANGDSLAIEFEPSGSPLLGSALLPFLSWNESGTQVSFAADGFEVPLDGDLRRLNGRATIDLGEAPYRLAGFLTAVLHSDGDAVAVDAPSAPVRLSVSDGVLEYEPLVLPIEEFELSLSGTYDLLDRTVHLRTEVPLSLLDTADNSFLEQYGELLGRLQEDVAIPILLDGPVDSPRMSVDADFRADFLDAVMGSFGKVVDLIGDQVDESVLGPLESLFGTEDP